MLNICCQPPTADCKLFDVGDQDAKIQAVFDAIREMMRGSEKPKRKIGFLEEPKATYRVR
jgi:hypothetical protein